MDKWNNFLYNQSNGYISKMKQGKYPKFDTSYFYIPKCNKNSKNQAHINDNCPNYKNNITDVIKQNKCINKCYKNWDFRRECFNTFSNEIYKEKSLNRIDEQPKSTSVMFESKKLNKSYHRPSNFMKKSSLFLNNITKRSQSSMSCEKDKFHDNCKNLCVNSLSLQNVNTKLDHLQEMIFAVIDMNKNVENDIKKDLPQSSNFELISNEISPLKTSCPCCSAHLNHSSPAKESYYFSNAVQHENESKPNIPKKKLCRSKPPAYETCDSSSKETCCYCKKRKKKRKTKSKPLGNPNDSSFTNVHPQNGKQVPMITNIPSNQELCYRQVPLSNNVLPKETNNNILIPPESNDVKVIIKELNSQKTNIEDLKNLVENCMDILNKTISEKDQDGPDVSETKSKRKASTTSFFRRFSSTFPKKENNQIKENDNYSPYQNTSPYLKPGATDIKNRNKSSSIVFLKRQSSNMSDDEETNDKNNKDEKTKKIPEVNKNRKNSQDIIDKNNKIKSSNLELKEIDRKDQAEKEKTTNKKKSKKKKKTLCFCCPSCCD